MGIVAANVHNMIVENKCCWAKQSNERLKHVIVFGEEMLVNKPFNRIHFEVEKTLCKMVETLHSVPGSHCMVSGDPLQP